MNFGGINYIAVVVAGFAGFGVGSVWYGIFGQAWMSALNKKKEDIKPSPGPFIIALLAQFGMAYILAVLIGQFNTETNIIEAVTHSVMTAGVCWAGFVITSMLVNHAFQGASTMLTIIDGGHWLLVLIVMAVIIGAFGA